MKDLKKSEMSGSKNKKVNLILYTSAFLVWSSIQVDRKNHSVRWAGAGAGGWSGVREKYWWLEAGAGAVWEENTVGLEGAGAAEQSD